VAPFSRGVLNFVVLPATADFHHVSDNAHDRGGHVPVCDAVPRRVRAFFALFAALVLYRLVFSPEASMSRAALLVIR
jgi:hypothetical protein